MIRRKLSGIVKSDSACKFIKTNVVEFIPGTKLVGRWNSTSKEFKKLYAEQFDDLILYFLVDRFLYKINQILEYEKVLSDNQRGLVVSIKEELVSLRDIILIEPSFDLYSDNSLIVVYDNGCILDLLTPVLRKRIIDAGIKIVAEYKATMKKNDMVKIEEAISCIERGNKSEDIPTWIHIMCDYTLAIRDHLNVLSRTKVKSSNYILIEGMLDNIERVSDEFTKIMDESIC